MTNLANDMKDTLDRLDLTPPPEVDKTIITPIVESVKDLRTVINDVNSRFEEIRLRLKQMKK